MPLTLRDSLEPLTLRDSARYSQNQGDFADYLEASDTNPISRGWTSVSEGLAGSDLLAQANAAERAGDINLSQALEQQAMDRMRRAQTWAPTTQSVRGIDGLGSAMEWAGGHVGGGARSMLAPLAGGVGGRVLGGLAGFAIGGPGGAAIGANLGGAAGAFVPSYDMQYNESVGQSMMDPEIRASRSAQDIHRTGQAAGAAGGVLEAIVPAGIGKTAVGGLGKRTIGGVLAREAGEEALTEGAQSLVGQTGQNQLAGRNLTDYDYMEALDAAAAGAVGGAGVSVGGAMVGAARDKLMAGGEKVVETARDPLGAIIQKGYELADKAGRKQARDEIAAGNTPQPLRTMYEEAAAQNADERIFQPPTQDETNEMITSRMREDANRWADRILSAQPRALSPRESELREAAAQFKSDGDWSKLRTVLRKNKLIEERESMMASFDAPGTKASEMTPEGKELDTLSQVWLQNEGKRYGEYFDDSNEAKGLGAKLFAWIKNDFGKSMTEDGEIFIPRAFIDALGERAPGVIESAITAARKEGWAIKDAGDAVSAVKEYVSSNEGDVGALKSAIRYTQEKNWTDKMLQRFAKELRQKNGQLDKDDYKWLKTQVVDPTALLKHFQKPSRFYKAEKNMGVKADTSLPQAARDQDEKAGITDNDAEWGSGVSEIEVDGGRKVKFVGVDKDGYPFDTSNDDQLGALRTKVSTFANDPAVFAKEIGVWQQAKRATKGDKALLTEYEDALIREHGNSLSDAIFQGELNPADLTAAERSSVLGQINKRFRTIEVEGVVADKDPHKIAKEDIRSFRVDSVTNNRRSPEKEIAKNGFIFLERNIGGKISYFPTTTARLLQHIRGNRRLSKEGAANIEREVKVSGKDRGAAGAMSHLEQAIADMIASDKTFTGRIGYKIRGEAKEPILLADKQRFPGVLSLGDGASTAADAYRGRKYEAMREGAKEVERDDGPKEIATVSRVDFTTIKHFMTTDPATGEKITSEHEARSVAQAIRATYPDVIGPEKRNGQWGVAYNTREENRSTEHLSETDEMSEGAGKKLERSVREFQEETGLSLEVDIPAGIKRMVAQVLQNARKAWGVADERQRNQLKKLIEAKNYFSANKLADTIRFSAEGAQDAKLPKDGHNKISRDARGGDQGRRSGARAAGAVSGADTVLQGGNRPRTGANSQDREADSNRDAGGRNQDGKSSDNAGGTKRKADEGNLAKQDAWVMKLASMSMKDMRAYINALPAGKLGKVFAALNVFHPADNSNPFWQRNDLDNYTDAKSKVVFEAQGLIRERLNEDGGVARVFAQDRQPTARQAEVLGKHYLDIEFKIATSKAQPLRLDAFHKVAKRVDPEFGLLGYAEQNSKKLRAWAEGARGFLLDLGFPVSDTRILFTDADDNTLGAHFGDVDAILLDKNVFEKALSGDKIEQANLPILLSHEASHALDNGVWNMSTGDSPRPSTKNHRFIVSNGYTIGDIGQEIIDVYNSRGEYWDHFAYPVSKTHNDLNAKDKVREAFAQLFTAYALDPSWSEKHTPKFFQLAQEIDNAATLKDVATIISGGTIDWTKFAAPDGKNPRANRRVDRRATGRVGRDTGITGESRPEIRLGLREGSLAGGLTKNSEQTTSDFKLINEEQALADIARMLGKDFDAKVVKQLGGKAGTWRPGIIKLATSAAEGTQFHEALHELFYQMRTNGAANVAQLVERVANSPLIKRKLEQLLSDHPKAIKQLDTPEEAAAYLFQFWNMGLINVGPETKSLFQMIKGLVIDAAKEIHSWINAAKRDERKAEKAAKMEQDEVRRLFEALAGGAAADPTTRTQLYDALRKNVEAHTKKVEELGQRVEGFWQGIGRYVVTSESMLNLYSKHPELKTVADKFHQMAGKSMKNQARSSSLKAYGGLIEAKHLEVQRRLNPFERFLMDGKYDEKDMALAAKHLEANTQSGDKKIQALVDYLHGYYGEMYDYMVQSDVRRLDPHSEERWVPIQKRKDYFTQSWSIEELTKDHDGFVSTLLDKHAKELAYMAQQANAEIAAWNKDPKTQVESATARVELDAAREQNRAAQEITPEMIAEQIYVRLLNSTGMVDIQETNWSLGLTPAAGAVNRRELDWLDKEAFSKYKSKDLVEIVTNYTRTMVSRAEYQKRFGYGGEVIGEAMDTAFLREMGGQALVDKARAELDGEVKRWKKEARAWHKDNPGVPFPEPYPTLRLVGVQAHRSQVGAEESNQAMIKAEKTLRPAVNAVRALEGTLGNDISPTMRNVNSWINTYQNVRLLPLALFTNFSDVIGITTNGGTLGDAWNAFTAGMREVRNTWLNEKGSDTATLRAEEWGVSDAGAMLDTLGQNYSSVYMTEKARNINNKFFRIIGMEGWNRGVRITATAVGERIIGDWVKNGVDAKKPGEKARFERLFGEGADPKNIKLDADGNLDTQDAANRAAIQRFVQDSVMSSNSAVRATWMSDPRMATFAHLKNFAYAFHSVMLKGILAQAAEGNLRPALVAGLGFASISIAAAAVKEMLIPGDEPYWMKGGLDGYLEYGYNMANLGGVPQMYLESVTDFDPAKLAGPFWDQIQNTLSSPIPGFAINFSPIDGETEILRDRKVVVELAKALPAGNIAGRAMDSMVGD